MERHLVRGLVMGVVCVCPTLAGAGAGEIRVDAAACPAVGSGSTADPYCSIQDGVDAAVAGDVVRVAAGRYVATALRSIDIDGFIDTIAAVLFLEDGVSVIGAGPGASTLDAGGRAGGIVADRCGAGSIVLGFTVANAGRGSGAGFDLADGVFVNGGAPRLADLEITATEGGFAALDIYGDAAPDLERLSVHDNGRVASVGAAVLVSGGARASIAAIVVSDNHGVDGGGIVVEDGVLFLANAIVTGNVGASGGGVRLIDASGSDIAFSTIAGNVSGIAGAGVRFEGSSAAVRGTLVIGNRSLSGQVGGVFADTASVPGMEGNDVFGNLDSDYQSRADPTGTNGNISADPLFLDFGAGDLRLAPGSPAIDRGPAASSGPVPAADVSGAPRPLDGDRDGDPRADIGALEFDRFEVRGLAAGESGPAATNAPEPGGVTAGGPAPLLQWSSLAGATGYLVHRGAIAGLHSGAYGACMTAGGDLAVTSFDDPEPPPRGDAFFYLVAARVAGAEQTLGFDWRGLERIGRPADACP